tara:strand:- start:582 stop:2159 length:1578 start_codon:yes stop_codon:yes gene_type:complete
MKNKFLTKNTKITLKEAAPPVGLRMAEKVHNEDGKINRDALKEIGQKLADYYGDELKAFEEPKVTGKDGVGSDGVDIYDIESLGAGSMLSLEYEAEGSEVEKKFKKRVDDLNDTSEYDKNFGTKDGFGETDEKDETYAKMKKASAEYNKYEDEYELPNPLRVKQVKEVKSESKDNKKKKMKRLNFKTPFKTEYEMLQLIPENYKQEGHTFLMTDGNNIFKVRWDNSLNEGTILRSKNKGKINEGIEKMKKLYNYEYSDSMGKTNDYITESQMMRKMMNAVKGKTLLSEQEAEYVDGPTIKDVYQVGNDKLGFQLATKVNKDTKEAYPSHLYVSVNGKGKHLLKPKYETDNDTTKQLITLKPSPKGDNNVKSAYFDFKSQVQNQFPDINFTSLENAINNKFATSLGYMKETYMSPNGETVSATYETDKGLVYTITGNKYAVINGDSNKPYGVDKYGPLTISTPKGEIGKINIQFQTPKQIKRKGGLMGLIKKDNKAARTFMDKLGNLESGSYADTVLDNLLANLVG